MNPSLINGDKKNQNGDVQPADVPISDDIDGSPKNISSTGPITSMAVVIDTKPETKTRTNFTNKSFHSWRYIILLLAAISNGLLVLVINMSLVQVRMVNQTAVAELYKEQPDQIRLIRLNDTNQGSSPSDSSVSLEDGPFVWSLKIQSLILNVYSFTFAACQILGSSVVDQLGPKLPSVIGHGLAASATVLIPFFAWYGWPLVVVLRLFVGVGMGFVYPSLYATVERWTPDNERGRAITLVQAGSGIGNAITSPLAGLLCSFAFLGGWPLVFYVDGLLVLIWIVCWLIFVSDTPDEHRKISEKEFRYIEDNRLHSTTSTESSSNHLSFVQIIKSCPIIAAIVVYSIYCGTNTIILMNLPAYFRTILSFDVTTNGNVNGYLQIAIIVSYILCGRLDDTLTNRRVITRGHVRKTLFSVGSVVTAIFFVGVGIVDNYFTSTTAIVCLFIMSRLFHGFCEAQLAAAVFDMAPGNAGHIMGVVNGISAISTFGIAYGGSAFLDAGSGMRSQWNMLFNICAGMLVFGAIIFCIFIKDQPVFEYSPVTHESKSKPPQDKRERIQ